LGRALTVCHRRLAIAVAAYAFLPFAIAAANAPTAHAQATSTGASAFGFGSMHVNFQPQPGELSISSGVHNGLVSKITSTQTGLITYVGNYGRAPSVPNQPTLPALRSTADANGDGVGDFATTDFGDIRAFNIGLEQIAVGQSYGLQSIDVCDVVWLSGTEENSSTDTYTSKRPGRVVRPAHDIELTRIEVGDVRDLDDSPPDTAYAEPFAVDTDIRACGNGIALVYGLRSFNSIYSFGLEMRGGIIGKTDVITTAENQIVAPQVGIAWVTSRGRWSLQTQRTALAGYNDGRVEQHSATGQELIPGAINRPLFVQPVQLSESHHAFSPGAEFRAETRYSVTDALSLQLAWSAVFFDNVLLADDRTTYLLPNFGLNDPGDQHRLTEDIYCGIKYVH
jgi:hypothetical protein